MSCLQSSIQRSYRLARESRYAVWTHQGIWRTITPANSFCYQPCCTTQARFISAKPRHVTPLKQGLKLRNRDTKNKTKQWTAESYYHSAEEDLIDAVRFEVDRRSGNSGAYSKPAKTPAKRHHNQQRKQAKKHEPRELEQDRPKENLFTESIRKICDLTNPGNWYPEARAIKRKIIFHAGPTNSGKTFRALKHLSSAKSGVYCGPLKLLANEVFDALNEQGVPCDLRIGDDQRKIRPDGETASHAACTVEMTPIETTEYDVAVLDEIQMIRDFERGHAWTRALLGLRAKEIHVCGEEAAVELIRTICEELGDDFEVTRNDRLSSLTIADHHIGSLTKVDQGDCFIVFDLLSAYRVAGYIRSLGSQVALVYGRLPADIKRAEVKLFNEGKKQALVATDAIGLGLNLNIKRIVFMTLDNTRQPLTAADVKQIAGRAGRFNQEFSDGTVTALDADDLRKLKRMFAEEPTDIQHAVIKPPPEVLDALSIMEPELCYSDLMEMLFRYCTVPKNFVLGNYQNQMKLIKGIEKAGILLPVEHTHILMNSPMYGLTRLNMTAYLEMARCIASNTPMTIDDMASVIEEGSKHLRTDPEHRELTNAIGVYSLYLWLSYRFEHVLVDREKVQAKVKQLEQQCANAVEREVDIQAVNFKKGIVAQRRHTHTASSTAEKKAKDAVKKKDKDLWKMNKSQDYATMFKKDKETPVFEKGSINKSRVSDSYQDRVSKTADVNNTETDVPKRKLDVPHKDAQIFSEKVELPIFPMYNAAPRRLQQKQKTKLKKIDLDSIVQQQKLQSSYLWFEKGRHHSMKEDDVKKAGKLQKLFKKVVGF